MLFNVFEPKLVDSLLYAMIEFFNHGIQGTATWSQLSLVPPLPGRTADLKRLHQNKTRSTRRAGKGLYSQLCHYWAQQTRKWAGSSLPEGSCEGVKSIPRRTTYHRTVSGSETPVQRLLVCWRIIYNRPPSWPHQVPFCDIQGDGRLIITQIPHWYPFTRPPSRSRAGHAFTLLGIK